MLPFSSKPLRFYPPLASQSLLSSKPSLKLFLSLPLSKYYVK